MAGVAVSGLSRYLHPHRLQERADGARRGDHVGIYAHQHDARNDGGQEKDDAERAVPRHALVDEVAHDKRQREDEQQIHREIFERVEDRHADRIAVGRGQLIPEERKVDETPIPRVVLKGKDKGAHVDTQPKNEPIQHGERENTDEKDRLPPFHGGLFLFGKVVARGRLSRNSAQCFRRLSRLRRCSLRGIPRRAPKLCFHTVLLLIVCNFYINTIFGQIVNFISAIFYNIFLLKIDY